MSERLVPAPSSVKLMSFGFDRLLADYYWLQLVSYVGDAELQSADKYSKAEQYIDLVVELDPNFISAYWFASFIIGGDLKSPARAAEILEKGINNNPDSWYIPFIAGINQFLFARDQIRAAKYYRRAAQFPEAPDWLVRQAEILETNSPLIVKEANSWHSVYKSTAEGPVKEHARERCVWLWVQVYKTAPNDAYRNRAREVLRELGVDVGSLKKPE